MTEGQIDSLSVAEAGIENAVSVPTGKNGFTWVRHCWDFLNRFDTLIVFGDHERDEITLLEEMKQRFNGIIKHVRPEDYKDCKDANEILQKYGKEQIKACIDNAVPVPVEMVVSMADVEDINPYSIEKLSTGIKQLDKKLKGGLPFGNVHILGGKRGDGKSTYGSQIIATALRNGYQCFMYSGEMLNGHVKSWLDFQIAGAKYIEERTEINDAVMGYYISNANKEIIKNWYRETCFIHTDKITNEIVDLLKTVEKVLQQGIRVILLDNLMTAIDLSIDSTSDKYERQSNFVKRLAVLAKRFDACIILIAHRRKSNGYSDDSNDEISGSGDITNLAGVVLSYDRLGKKDLEDGRGTTNDRKLILAKNRLFGITDTDGQILHYDAKSKRIYGDDDDKDFDFGIFGDGFFDANDLRADEEINPFA
jgi:KaiC/GvpD/RAD55 family RecA-like ATPase